MAWFTLDPDLVDAARQGDPDAVERLAEQALPTVLGWCLRLGGPTVDAEDAAHEVLLVVIDRVHTVRDPYRFPSWMFQVTRKVLARHRRKAWFARWVPGMFVDVPDEQPDPSDRCAMSETALKVGEALDEMPEAQREVFVLCDVEEHTDEEAAALLGIPIGTVKSRLRLARERFRKAARRLDIVPDLVEVRERDGQ